MNNFNDNLIKKASKSIGITPEKLSAAAKTNNFEEIFKHLNKEDAQKIKNVLNSKQNTKDFLNSPETKEVLNNLFKKQS